MILYVLKQNKNTSSRAYGKYFAYPVIEETIDLDGLAGHMANHNTPFSKGAKFLLDVMPQKRIFNILYTRTRGNCNLDIAK